MAKKKTGRNKSASARMKSASGKMKSASGKMKAAKSTGRMKAASARKSAARPAARPRGGHELVPVICSECYEEFMFDSGAQTDGIMCPVCEHEASRPDDATLHHIAEKRRQEKSGFLISFVLFMVALGSFGGWAYLMVNPANAMDDGMFYGPIGVAGLCTILLLIFSFKYENNRWEVYF